MNLILDVINKLFVPITALYISYLNYKLNKLQAKERKCIKQEENEKDTSFPPRSKRKHPH